MSRSKRILIGILSAVIVLVLVAGAARVACRPMMPQEWRRLHAGMSREEVLATVAGERQDLRELKGMESFTQETTMLGGSSYWQLIVSYDQSGRLMHADACFIHRSCGLLSRAYPQSVL